MLARRAYPCFRAAQRASQRGVVLFVSLIVLVALLLAAAALMRSVDTSNIIAGNLTYQQSAINSGDAAVEQAIAWLENCSKGINGCASGTLDNDYTGYGYSANGNSTSTPHSPGAGQTWNDYWLAQLDSRKKTLPTDTAHNTPSYVIDRLCESAGPAGGASCVSSPVIAIPTGNAEEAGERPLPPPIKVYYRITVRTTGPKNTVSYIQVNVAI